MQFLAHPACFRILARIKLWLDQDLYDICWSVAGTLTVCLFFFLQKLLLHLNQVSTSHPKERFDLYHKLQNLFDKWMFHLRYVDFHVRYCRCSVQLTINEFPMINRTKNVSDTLFFWPKRPENNWDPFGTEKYSETLPLGHLYSRDKKFGPRKMFS